MSKKRFCKKSHSLQKSKHMASVAQGNKAENDNALNSKKITP